MECLRCSAKFRLESAYVGEADTSDGVLHQDAIYRPGTGHRFKYVLVHVHVGTNAHWVVKAFKEGLVAVNERQKGDTVALAIQASCLAIPGE